MGWSACKSAKQVHDLDVVCIGMVSIKLLQRVDTAHSNCQHIAAEHLRALLVAFVQQALMPHVHLLLGCTDLLLGCRGVLVGDCAAPQRQW